MLARIQDKLARAADRLGRLNPTLSESELTAFERDFRVTLPDEYRAFLLRVGDGGRGRATAWVPSHSPRGSRRPPTWTGRSPSRPELTRRAAHSSAGI